MLVLLVQLVPQPLQDAVRDDAAEAVVSDIHVGRAGEAMKRLIRETNPWKQRSRDLAEVCLDVETTSVWVVCDRKGEPRATALYNACIGAFKTRKRFELAFFPPDTAADAEPTHLPIAVTGC